MIEQENRGDNVSLLHPWRGIRPWRRHSLVLMVCGLVYILIGTSFIITKPSSSRTHALAVALRWMPMDGWGIIFVLAGMMAIISSRWPPISETWGYTVLSGLSGAWSAVYLVGIWFKHAPASNYSQALIWGLIAFLWWAITGLINPDKAVPLVRR